MDKEVGNNLQEITNSILMATSHTLVKKVGLSLIKEDIASPC